MRFFFCLLCLFSTITLLSPPATAQPSAGDRIQLEFKTDEAEAVLAIVDKQASRLPVSDADWQRLFATEPYIRLKKREASMKRDFTDEDFKKFTLSPELAKRAPELHRTLEEWKKADLAAAARRVLPYLPAEARIRAKVFPVIKPQTNSFVFETDIDPTIFLYLNPTVTQPEFENTVAHEMHHIGFASISAETDASLKDLPANVKTAVQWMGAFGEGFAMLAAAGGPDIHPHATSKAEDRTRWEHDMANYNRDLETLDKFFRDVISQKLKTEDEINQTAFSFFGEQGPWYTVGYKMAVTIERQFGRATLIECMVDLRKFIPAYNRAASEQNKKGGEQLALWSLELVKALGGK